jgi:C1A family cysteine protease
MADDWSHVRGFGWKPQTPDHRDYAFARAPGSLPDKIDLRQQMPPVYDQGQLNSCTANSLAAAMEYERVRQSESDFVPSRLFIWYNERDLEGSTASNVGASLRDGIKVLNKDGVCPESIWPYDPAMFASKPPRRAYVQAKTDVAVQYEAIQSLGDLKGALAQSLAVVFGFAVYESFESAEVAKSGIVPLPAQGEKQIGGHAVLAVGYSDPDSRITVRNSWGPDWGMSGYFVMPYEYLTGPGTPSDASSVNGAYLANDFWAIQKTK